MSEGWLICRTLSEFSLALREAIAAWGHWSVESVSEALATGNYILLGLFENNMCKGLAFVMQSAPCADLIYVYTNSQFRRQGIGLKLLEACEDLLKRETQCEKFLLEVRSDNVSAQSLYERFGMRLIQTRKKYYDNACDALIYVKDLV